MAPIRRYLRISKYSVLECRVYLEFPSDSRWLLDSRDPVLPRVISAVRPLVLPKLREENERLFMRKKGKPVKDVIAEDDFEVAIFLRESRTRHSLLTRNKTLHGKERQAQNLKLELNQEHVSEDTAANPVNPGDGEIMIESDSEPDLGLHNIPESADEVVPGDRRRSSRRTQANREDQVPEDTGSDEKKLGFSTHYESFNIYGWVLCLLITRKGDKTRPSAVASESNRQPLMEEWISTQAQVSVDDE
ncbi:hypothetical protein E8E15_008717 [Penicillium rubens]|uniref:Pc18g05070 protein n=2 Tax=Penicillium chrysogenum species complex TaxID=254878 RepID=B6HBX6_PENRW|nr:uncharacterized protein N7525_000506 [Penicillium rubens]KZN92186.1 hypothetical protein EN45_023350 [Penicillium chrysogenum]CAP94731.1 Pc18g05070 [Penicillium rubens Wisconsin 54-1255]KAF3020499.1 hypothetical protein E8E15_008717 [Penicillium rubens]KAJ5039755.1 hypothetical protein NUH16_009543 [Penicillium rubens]KAJ5842765.1 hypothetical protein N7525_000506 [Penicillium rubens]